MSTPEGGPGKRWQGIPRGVMGGAVLILVGGYFLLNNLGYLPPISWRIVWPVALIALGLWLLVRRFT